MLTINGSKSRYSVPFCFLKFAHCKPPVDPPSLLLLLAYDEHKIFHANPDGCNGRMEKLFESFHLSSDLSQLSSSNTSPEL